MIKAYWLRLALFAAAGALIALTVSLMSPKKYEAIIGIMIDQKAMQPNIAGSAIDTVSQDVMDFGRARSLTTAVNQLVSLGVIMEAANRVAQQRNLADPLSTPSSELFPPSLQQSLAVSAEATSDIITLSVRMSDRVLAQDVAREMYLAFIDQNRRSSRALAEQALSQLQPQYEALQRDLRAVDTKITELKLQSNAPDVVMQTQADIQLLSSLRTERERAELDLSAATRRMNELQAVLATMPKESVQSTNKTLNPTFQRLEAQLSEARQQREALLERYTPEREEVKTIDRTIVLIQDQMAKTPKEIDAATTRGQNPNYLSLMGQYNEAKAIAKAAEGRLSTARSQVANLENASSRFP
ncbi:MAG TPA: hypothetical protein VEX38_02855, partial [Fimbriimonadaceae bacterium]|nr:hypothetical protein [Fimbriimonadaceae bacterium]